MGWLERWELYQITCEQLESELGADVYAELLAFGANLDLDTVVLQLLAE
jgi:hypothetical protein